VLKLCKTEGIHTALDTSGYGSWKSLTQILKYTDLVLYDIKHMNPTMHKENTGVEGKDMIIRVPLIPIMKTQRIIL
jgi:pyruvate formate lyase activating enzyme